MEVRVESGSSRIKSQVREFIIDNFLLGTDHRQFLETDSFVKNGIIDSTGILELIQFLELTFGINVSEHETLPENLDSLANVAAYVERKLKNS